MNKYIAILLMLFCSALGWWLWHHEEADFMAAWTGSMAFFSCIVAIIITLLFGPNTL